MNGNELDATIKISQDVVMTERARCGFIYMENQLRNCLNKLLTLNCLGVRDENINL